MRAYSTFLRVVIAAFSFVLFGAIGFVVAVVLSTYSLWPDDRLIAEALPLMLGFGGVAGFLAYRYPGVFGVLLWFMP